MTGQPSYRFRGSEKAPVCKSCKIEMTFVSTLQELFGEEDLYKCMNCGAEFRDVLSF
jgi:DNA-directed RNA polymerase subunit M/transcription elongation factor TFIIS